MSDYSRIISPVDYYNINKVEHVFEFMVDDYKCVYRMSETVLSYIVNKSDNGRLMIFYEKGYFVAKEETELGMAIGDKYSPFMMLTKFKFKNNILAASDFVEREWLEKDVPFIRVGPKYFKLIGKDDRYGIHREELRVWDKLTIVDDYGRNYLKEVPTFDDFVIKPDNKIHTRTIGNNYNLYSPFNHKPCKEEEFNGELGMYWTMTLMEHIFGEQLLTGLKYMKVLYDTPWMPLPILVMTSDERQTGKSTYINYMSILFGGNTVIINPQDIGSSFNVSYADKNIIMIEESKFEGTQTMEKLKNLSTQKEILVNTKFVNPYSIPFYGKLIITSNDETKFSRVDDAEIRYWVRKVPSLKGKANHQILESLASEIPQFLYYLDHMDPIDFTKSRMVFEAVELNTKALETVKAESLPSLHKDLEILLDSFCIENKGVKEIKFTAKHVKEMWFNHNHKIELNYVNRILRDSMKVSKGKMQRFIPFETKNNMAERKISGQPFVFKNKYFNELDITKKGNENY